MAMTKEQWIATAGSVVAVGGGIAVQRGWISGAQLSILSGEIPNAVNAIYAVVAMFAVIAPVFYSVWANFKSKRIASVAALPNVQAVVMTTEEGAKAIPPDNVVGPSAVAAPTPAAQ